MENVYRRDISRERRVEHLGKSERFSFKKLMIKQSVVCIMIFLAATSIGFSPEGSMSFEKNAVKFILSHNTDFKKLPADLNAFVKKYIFRKPETSSGKEALLDMTLPLEGEIESPFGMRQHPTENVEKFHYGIDISAPEGEKIVCAQSGTAKEVAQDNEYGNYIVVDHGDEICTLYAHCSEIIANVGDEIQAGQLIARVGATGNVTGPHLHFEIRDDDEWLDPAEFMDYK